VTAPPRPKPRLRRFTLAAILSLLLCLAFGGLWARSLWVDDTIEYASGSSGGLYAVRSLYGYLSFDTADRRLPNTPLGLHWHRDPLDGRGRQLAAEYGPRLEDFGVRTYTRADDEDLRESGASTGFRSVAISYWLLVAAAAILPAAAAYRRFRPAWVSPPRCARCGAELPADATRCPACGAESPVK
jgi:hypothetical protein